MIIVMLLIHVYVINNNINAYDNDNNNYDNNDNKELAVRCVWRPLAPEGALGSPPVLCSRVPNDTTNNSNTY